jgi:hypothetical protein
MRRRQMATERKTLPQFEMSNGAVRDIEYRAAPSNLVLAPRRVNMDVYTNISRAAPSISRRSGWTSAVPAATGVIRRLSLRVLARPVDGVLASSWPAVHWRRPAARRRSCARRHGDTSVEPRRHGRVPAVIGARARCETASSAPGPQQHGAGRRSIPRVSPVVHDVDNVAVRCPYEEPPHAPGLLRQFVFETTDASTVIASTPIHDRRWRAAMERLGMTYAREIHRPEGSRHPEPRFIRALHL